MVFRKKQLLIVAMVCVICVAAFINWQFNRSEADSFVDDTQQASKNLGEAKLVNTDDATGDGEAQEVFGKSDYFAEARLNRTKARDEAMELLKSVVADTNNTEEARNQATQEIGVIATNIEKEANIESLIKAKGFSDCVAVIGGGNVNIVVKSSGLQANEAAQLNEIVVNETGISADKIKIIEVK